MSAAERNVLMVAFHFPPLATGSGYIRTLKFAEYLSAYGWHPTVLTVHPRAHLLGAEAAQVDDEFTFPVVRAFALDARVHLSIGGRYPQFIALPDRWSTWVPHGVRQGMKVVARARPRVLFSTFPIASAHLIGLTLHRRSRIPWVADFRDPMTYESDASTGLLGRVTRRLERRTVEAAARSVFTTPGARRDYAERYPEVGEDRFRVIQNGYDEESFAHLDAAPPDTPGPGNRPARLVHAGLLYRDLRNPSALFEALGELRRAGRVTAARLHLVLRASGFEHYYRAALRDHGIEDIVELAPGIPYREALREMMASDGLLLLQSAQANRQIPAKLYEYIRARRPILALTDPDGDTAAAMIESGVGRVLRIDSAQDIAGGLVEFLDALEEGTASGADEARVAGYSRRARAAELARLFDEVEAGA